MPHNIKDFKAFEPMTRDEKVLAVSELTEVVGSASAFYFTDYQGLTVAQATELRNQFRKAGVK